MCTRCSAYTSSQRSVAKYVRAVIARGTRQRGYFAAAVAARFRDRFRPLWPPSCKSPSASIEPRFTPSLSFSFSFTVSVAFFPFVLLLSTTAAPSRALSPSLPFSSLGFSNPFSATRPGALAGMRRSGVAVVVPH